MTVWLAAQFLYAIIVWYLAARVVARTFRFGGSIGRDLAATIRELRHADRVSDVARLGAALEPSPVSVLLETDADAVSPMALVTTAETVSRDVVPPLRLLRSLATVGTMLGLLSAVATLRGGLDVGATRPMEIAASLAFDSAVVGFVTAIPCWTAVALCGRRARETYADLDRVVLALRSVAKVPAPDPSNGSER